MKKFAIAVLLASFAAPALAKPGDGQPAEREGRRRDPERMQQMLERFDTDGDGKLSEAERQAAREARGDRQGRGRMGDPAAMFQAADKDGNGQLSQEEFVAFLEQMRAGRPGGDRGPRADRGERGPRERGERGPRDRGRPAPENDLE